MVEFSLPRFSENFEWNDPVVLVNLLSWSVRIKERRAQTLSEDQSRSLAVMDQNLLDDFSLRLSVVLAEPSHVLMCEIETI